MARSDGFTVDPGALSAAQAGVGRLLQNMNELERVKSDYPPSVFGHAELAESVSGFHDRWQSGAEGLVKDTELIHRRLGETVSEYRRIDDSVAAVFDRLRGGNAR